MVTETANDPATKLRLALSFRAELRICQKCPLHVGTRPVPWSGDFEPTFALMGEGPGQSEERDGRPFTGKAGYHMRQWLREVGIDDKSVAYLNAVSCRPPSNRTPHSEEVAACRPWVHGQLEFIRPKVLITVGVTAFHSILGRDKPKLANLHGKPLFIPHINAQWWATYHPSAAIRGFVRGGQKYETIIKHDLAMLMRAMEDGFPFKTLDECYVCGKELYRYDENGIGLCSLHAQFQGMLFA